MKDFEYYAPPSLQDAVSLKDKFKDAARFLAGGTDLVVQMKNDRVNPSVLIDIKRIPELNRLEWKDGQLFIGAAVPLSKIINYAPIKQHFGVLHQACSSIGSLQLRNRGTMGGNICNAAPSADSAPALLCLGSKAVLNGFGGTRRVPLENFFSGPGQTLILSDEVLIGIEVPDPPPRSYGHYMKHIPRQCMDIAVASAASFLVFNSTDNTCSEARIALGAVAPVPIRVPEAENLLKGNKPLTSEIIESAAEKAAKCANPISDVRSSASYRLELIKVLVSRTLKMACHSQGITI